MAKLKSSVPGMVYPTGRDHFLKTTYGFLEGRRKDDGAEGLWRIHNNLYDLESFINHHPGGSEWLTITKGTDVTEAFECHHLFDKAEKLLPKYFVREAASPRSLSYTFASSGFFKKFKERVRKDLKRVDVHNPATKSKLIADFCATLTIVMAITTAIFKSWIFVAVSGLFLTWTVTVGHNFFHMKDNFRMYYFDLSTMSSKEWRISHALSHHLYPNTLWDMEVYLFEPFYQFLPKADKSYWQNVKVVLISPLVMSATFFWQGIKRYYSLVYEWKSVELRDFVPFLLPLVMSFFAPSPFIAIKLWLCILLVSSFLFTFIGLTAAHHHPEIFHDGDVCRDVLDWGLMELDAVRDRKIIDDSTFLTLTNFGMHGIHHLVPTVDHAYLHLCVPAFVETCREFGVDTDKLTSWELVKGKYRQLIRSEPRLNYRR